MDEYSSWKGWAAEQFGQFNKRAARYYGWHIQRACGARDGLRVLEVGFGNGSFMGWLKAHGHHVMGIEANPELVRRAHDKGFDACNSLEELSSNETGFDLIAAFDVAEHVPTDELPSFLRTLRDRSAPNGRLMLRYPNGDSPFSLLHQNGDLTHITAIGRAKLQQAAQLSGWRVEHVGDAPWWADQNHARSLRGATRALLRQAFERSVGYMYYSEHLDLRPNMVSVLVPFLSRRGDR